MASVRTLARETIKRATSNRGKEMVPVYILGGMITMALGFGLHTAKQQLLYAPDVRVTKTKRETLPEVVDPDVVVDESRHFIDKSFFRKVAHIREPGDLPSKKPRVETLKEVGVDPKQI